MQKINPAQLSLSKLIAEIKHGEEVVVEELSNDVRFVFRGICQSMTWIGTWAYFNDYSIDVIPHGSHVIVKLTKLD